MQVQTRYVKPYRDTAKTRLDPSLELQESSQLLLDDPVLLHSANKALYNYYMSDSH